MNRQAVLTIRLPPALHAAFRELAYERRKSMNAAAIGAITEAVARNPAALRKLREGSERPCRIT
jgi:predicted transcriptional regulator